MFLTLNEEQLFFFSFKVKMLIVS